SGPAGLAGMAGRRGRLVRPLLQFSRRSILAYARAQQLDWWEDPANQSPRHLRSWLRAQILPRLAERLPDLSERLRAAGNHAALDRLSWLQALRSWPGLEYRREAKAESVKWSVLIALGPALQVALLQTLTRRSGVHPGSKRIRAALRTLRMAQSGAQA